MSRRLKVSFKALLSAVSKWRNFGLINGAIGFYVASVGAASDFSCILQLNITAIDLNADWLSVAHTLQSKTSPYQELGSRVLLR
jgi:hypothetical protein